MYRCSSAIGHKHYTTSCKLLNQQWVVAKDSVANCKHCKAITSLLFSGVDVWAKSGFKGLFSNFKMINIQHWPCCQSIMTSAAFKTTGNSEISDFSEFKTTGNSGKKLAQTGKITVIQLGILYWELGPLSRATTWRPMTSLWSDVFFWVPSCLESTINPENARLWWQSLMTTFSHMRDLCATFLFKWAQHNKVSPKMYCILL